MSADQTAATEAADPTGQPAVAEEFKIKLWERPWLITKTFLIVTLMTIFGMGVYTIFLETQIPLFIHVGSFYHGVYIGGVVATNTILWHHLVKNPFYRHGIRKLMESLSAGVVGLTYGFNPYKKKLVAKRAQPMTKWEAFQIKKLHLPHAKDNEWRAERGLPALSGKQVIGTAIVAAITAAIASGILLFAFAKAGHFTASIGATGPSWVQTFEEIFTGPVAYTIIGFMVSPLVKHRFQPVIDDFQDLLAQKWIVSGKEMTFFWKHVVFTPQFRHRIHLIEAAGGKEGARQALADRSKGLKIAMIVGVVLFFAIVGVGAKVKVTGSFYS